MAGTHRPLERIDYYARNIVRDVAPQFLFRNRLERILSRAAEYDAADIRARLAYCNKLSEPSSPEALPYTVGSIPMDQSYYYYDLKEHARYFPRRLRLDCAFGDIRVVPDRPSFLKSRPVGADNANAVLMKLDRLRHFHLPADPVSFADKKPMAVWRGGGHNPKRAALIRRYAGHPLCDVGQTGVSAEFGRARFMTPAKQMRYRYIISIEGNDVATNLKWIMASNSLCLMPEPRFETWFMEGRLRGGTHYVRLADDFADLEDRIVHYERHPDAAREIVQNANTWVAQFMDACREGVVSLLVMYKYFVMTGQLRSAPAVADLMQPAPAPSEVPSKGV